MLRRRGGTDSWRRGGLLAEPPDAQPSKAERDARDAEASAPHAKHGFAGEDPCLLLLKLCMSGKVAVRRQPQKRAAACILISHVLAAA